ncbi:MAG: hypothetical protein GY701_07085 [Sulfitobacter sp.]|nr:hypothetical protein [Sulfitobacter sp.]
MAEDPKEDPTDNDLDLVSDLRKRGDNEKARADEAERKLAFIEAGIDVSKGAGKLAFEKFEGEFTAEAAQAAQTAAATEYGISLEAPPKGEDPEEDPKLVEVDPQVTQQRQEQAEVRQALNQGGVIDPKDQPAPHPGDEGLKAFFQARADGDTEENAQQQYLGRIFEAAAQGDERVIYQG